MSEKAQPAAQPQAPAKDIQVRFRLPAAGFAFVELFEEVPDARVEYTPTVAGPGEKALMVIEADCEVSAVETALRADSEVEDAQYLSEDDGAWAYRLTWGERPRRVFERLSDAGIILLSACGEGGQWEFTLVLSDREELRRAHELLQTSGCGANCLSIRPFDGGERCDTPLTDEQRAALTEAFRGGYYEIPRQHTISEIAETLDISHQALSERLRRAHERVVETQLALADGSHLGANR